MYQVLFLNNIFDIIVLAVLAIAGVFAGIMFHIRSYLYLGALFLVLNIVVNLFRIGIQDRVIGMVFLFVTGLLLLVSAVYFNLKRDELLKTYTEWREKVSEWEG
jgi:predicted membrane channel-forming protein YqfA (hemolysin III family)